MKYDKVLDSKLVTCCLKIESNVQILSFYIRRLEIQYIWGSHKKNQNWMYELNDHWFRTFLPAVRKNMALILDILKSIVYGAWSSIVYLLLCRLNALGTIYHFLGGFIERGLNNFLCPERGLIEERGRHWEWSKKWNYGTFSSINGLKSKNFMNLWVSSSSPQCTLSMLKFLKVPGRKQWIVTLNCRKGNLITVCFKQSCPTK